MASTVKKGTFTCLNCQNCSSKIKGDQICHSRKGYKIPIQGYYTCNSENVIYQLKCPCGKSYIGQTSHSIKIRLNEHKSKRSKRLYKSRMEKIENIDKGKKYGE